MPKQAISVTLEEANLTWLRGRALAAGRRSVSEMLDRLVTQARAGRGGSVPGIRSVVGTISITEDDPELRGADAEIRALFRRRLRVASGRRGRRKVGKARAPRSARARSRG